MSEESKEYIGRRINVLNDGFVRLVEVMGDDQAVVQAARVSYGAGTKSVSQDQGLINYLMRQGHTSPFEMAELKIHVRVPMDVWRQWIRHRTANVNEYSTRYSIAIDSQVKTDPEEWRLQSSNNKQGSSGYMGLDMGQALTASEKMLHMASTNVYEERIEKGIAREQARKDLPLSTYTEAYWKIDLHNLLNFLRLRLDSHAQLEIRLYAEAIAEFVKQWVPLTWNAFENYVLQATTFSGKEQALLVGLLNPTVTTDSLMLDHPWFTKDADGNLKGNTERTDFENKLHKLEILVPWLLK